MVTRPEEFFGFRIGEDRRLARWDRIVEYFYRVASESPRVKVEELGKTPGGNSFIVAYITSPANMARLDRLRDISCRLANPEKPLDPGEVEALVREGRAVVVITNSIHATEVGGTQMSVELLYRLASSSDEETLRILDNVVTILFPSFNPDGQVMVVDYYNKYLGTEYEGTPLPWLYHSYCGHDNNRDAYMLNLAESRFFARIAYHDWCPQVYIDHHQMGSYGARFFVSPEMDPIYPDVDPITWREAQFLGTYVATRLEMEGIRGVETGAPFTPDFVSAFQTIAYFMNIVGILTESASAKIASPIYIHPHQLRGYGRGRVADRPYMNYPNPWPGGWWRLGDIVRQQLISSIAILNAVALNKDMFLRNAYIKALRNIERGSKEPPYGFIIPPDGHDPLTTIKLIDLLLKLGIKVYRALEPVRIGPAIYPEGSFLVPLSQSRRPLAKRLLERYLYPDIDVTRDKDGKPIRPYDIATDTVADFMGVEAIEASEPIRARLERITSIAPPASRVERARGYLIDPRLNDSYRVINMLLAEGVRVWRFRVGVEAGGLSTPPGGFYVEHSEKVFEILLRASRETGVSPAPVSEDLLARYGDHYELRQLRIGVYQRYYGGNMEEGWTRFVLDTYGYSYRVVRDDDIKGGRLGDAVDLVIFPDDALPMMTGENIEEEMSKRLKRPFKLPPYPPEYRSGFGKEGIQRIREFVEKGGSIVTMGSSVELAYKGLGLPIRDLTEEITDPRQLFCPGSMLRAIVDTSHPLGYGMPSTAYIMLVDKPVLEIIPSHNNDDYVSVVTYPERDILRSGWLIGESILARKPALVDCRLGSGRVVIYGFRPIFRAQTHGTFKLFFNALYNR